MTEITQEQYVELSKEYGLEIALIKAVEQVESNGDGYLSNEDLKILFEGHIFSKLTNGKYDKSNLTISYLKWVRTFYKGGIAEYDRLEEAYKLDALQALKSASWGTFQIMGFNYEVCGYSSVVDFVQDVRIGLYYCLKHFFTYCTNRKLIDKLKKKDWRGFAKSYNGLGYEKNSYHTKLENAYKKYKHAI